MIVGCGDLTILLLGLGFHCFLFRKRKTASQPWQAIAQRFCSTWIYLLTLLTFPYFQGFPPLKILYMYPFPLFLPLWDNYKGKFIIQLFNRCLPLYQEGRQLPPFVCYLSVKDWNFTLSHKDTNYFFISLSYIFFEYTTVTIVANNK